MPSPRPPRPDSQITDSITLNVTIKTSTFGGWRLSGDAAIAFQRQIKRKRSKAELKKLKDSLEKGKQMLSEMEEKGYATIHTK